MVLTQVLGIGAFDLQRTLDMDPEFLDTEGEHVHDQSITSIGIDLDQATHGPVDLGLYNAWLDVLLREKGADLFRMKGVLAVKGIEDKYAFHAVHMIYKGLSAGSQEKRVASTPRLRGGDGQWRARARPCAHARLCRG